MKKMTMWAFALVASLSLTACGYPDDPEKVAEKFLDAYVDQDWEGCVKYMYVDEEYSDKMEELIREQALLELKMWDLRAEEESSRSEDEKVVSYEIKECDIDDEDGRVRIKEKYADGSSDDRSFRIKKGKNNKWGIKI